MGALLHFWVLFRPGTVLKDSGAWGGGLLRDMVGYAAHAQEYVCRTVEEADYGEEIMSGVAMYSAGTR